MSIIRHEIRQISDENRGQPIISQAVVHGNVAYFAGITPNPIVGDIKAQTAQVLRRVDELLNLAGTDKSKLLSAQVWIADMRLFEDHNSVWNEWVDPANPPVRACLTTDFGDLGCSLKLWWLRPCRESREKQLAVVRFGSKADICAAKSHVRFTPESGMCGATRDVRFVPKADSCSAAIQPATRSARRRSIAFL
jgi:enamine deaminase RidA (YjgF/YER057c/UK114 family)